LFIFFKHKKTPTKLSGLKQRFENSFLTSVPYMRNITTTHEKGKSKL